MCIYASASLVKIEEEGKRSHEEEKNDQSDAAVTLCKERWTVREKQRLGGPCCGAQHNNEFQISYSLEE